MAASNSAAARRARERRAAKKAATPPTTPATTDQPNTRGPATQEQANAAQRDGARQLAKRRPLAEVVAEANAKGYLGEDGADAGVQVRVSGVDGPGGHPQDATSRKSVGAAAR